MIDSISYFRMLMGVEPFSILHYTPCVKMKQQKHLTLFAGPRFYPLPAGLQDPFQPAESGERPPEAPALSSPGAGADRRSQQDKIPLGAAGRSLYEERVSHGRRAVSVSASGPFDKRFACGIIKAVMDVQTRTHTNCVRSEEASTMKKLFEYADQYIQQSDWKDLAMIKFCLAAMGVLIGVSLPLMAKFFRIAAGRGRAFTDA